MNSNSQVSHGTNIFQRQKRWRIAFISLTVITVVFYILGGALVGAAYYNCTYEDYDGYGDLYLYYGRCYNTGMRGAGIAFIVLACIAFLLWLVALIMRFTSWYRGPNSGAAVQHPTTYASANPTAQAAPVAAHTHGNVAQAPVAAQPHVESEKTGASSNIAMTEIPAATHFCSNCEHQTTGQFCTNCGSKVI